MRSSNKLLERFEVIGNQIPIKTLNKVVNWLIKNDKKPVKLTLEVIENQRSLQANNYYWELLEIVSNEIGESKEELHELMKFNLLSEQKEIQGEVYLITKSTTSLTVSEFQDYIEGVKNLIYEMFPDIILPDYVV